MSNFAFLRTALPEIADDCMKAESYLGDPGVSVIMARRAAERIVDYLYDVLALPTPYRSDFNALIHAHPFTQRATQQIVAKLDVIRIAGNQGAHANRPVSAQMALEAVEQLHHVAAWTAFHHSTAPDAVDMTKSFDATLAQKALAPSKQQVLAFLAKVRADEQAKAEAASEQLRTQHAAEIAELQAQITAAQAAKKVDDDRDYDEARTRDLFIDLLLGEAGWPLAHPEDREYEVTGMPNQSGTGFIDYVLWGSDGEPLAIVEAKRTRTSPSRGQQQAKLYADALEAAGRRRPVIFLTNGYEHWIWDDAAFGDTGYPPRPIQGFLTRDELELAIQRRTSRAALATQPIDTSIAGRPYQARAIGAVGDAFDARQREALLVMATGSGKTRTVIALIDRLMKAGWVKRALFLADRTALVKQAADAFTAHLPSVASVNLVTERNGDGRVYLSTYPTMMGLIGETVDRDGAVLRRFGSGFFDLIVIDEAHRSVYAKYGAIFDYFDAKLVGLTATPKDEVDHNTYRLFHLEDGVPTDAYSLEEAVADGYLVPPRGVAIGTRFLRHGIRYADLSPEEQDDWDGLDWGDGDIPDEVGAEEINRFLFNEDTVDQVLSTLMLRGYKVAGGDRLAKTIVFAKSQAHADFIERRFNAAFPEHGGTFARTITHGTPYAQTLIEAFSQPDKAPHIAISVDMLDTGIDVPDVANLVFFKLVRSKSKFWQMIGRGTRLRPDLFGPGEAKRDFLVFDFCGNLEFFSQDLPGSEGSTQRSVTQRIVETRLDLVAALGRADDAQSADLRDATIGTLHAFVAGLSLDNVLVRPHRRAVERFASVDAWSELDAAAIDEARSLAGLPSSARDADEHAKRFDLLVLRRQLAQLEGDAGVAERMREAVQAIAAGLLGKTTIPSVQAQAVLLEQVASEDWWVDVTLPMLELARVRMRDLVRFVDRAVRNPVYTDFQDELSEPTVVDLPHTTPGTDFERFRAKTTAYLRQHESHVALQRLQRNQPLTPLDLQALAQLLRSAGAADADIEAAAEASGGLGLFVRSLVGLDRVTAQEAFAQFLDGSRFSVAQVRFANHIVTELTKHGVVDVGRLYEPPYVDDAPSGPDHLFGEGDLDSIVVTLRAIRDNAAPGEGSAA